MIVIVILVLAALLTTGLILFRRFRTFSGYRVDAVLQMSNSRENTVFYPYADGYLKCAADGVTFFNSRRVVWSENFSMVQPVTDICGNYIAVADMTQRNVYLYDKSGYVNRINLAHNITGVEVSRTGVIAVSSNEGNMNYLDIRDKNGNTIMTEKNVFSSSGYLMDLSLSEDGSRLAAVYVQINKGTLKSKVVFYDLSGGVESSNIIAGSFDQYDSVLLTNVEFMDQDNVVFVAGDTMMAAYRYTDTIEPIFEERDFPWEIQSLFFSDRYVGMIVEESDTDTRYSLRVFDHSGEPKLEKGIDLSYSHAGFAGDQVVLYSYNDCLIYSLDGIEKFYGSFDQHIEALGSGDGVHFVYGTNADTEFITLN